MARLAKDVLAEIPEQFLSYMRARGIKPSPAPPPYTPPTHVLQTQIWLCSEMLMLRARQLQLLSQALLLVLSHEPGNEKLFSVWFQQYWLTCFLDPKLILFLNQNCKYDCCMSNRKIVWMLEAKYGCLLWIFTFFFFWTKTANFHFIVGKKHKLCF